VRRRLARADWAAARADVEPFLETNAALDWLTRAHLNRLLADKETP
jgi:hypothetical protein